MKNMIDIYYYFENNGFESLKLMPHGDLYKKTFKKYH